MNGQPKFAIWWKAAVVIALLASIASYNRAEHQKELANLRYEKRLDAMESSIRKIETHLYDNVASTESKNQERVGKIETFLYDKVAGTESKNEERFKRIESWLDDYSTKLEQKNEQRMSNIEKSLKAILEESATR